MAECLPVPRRSGLGPEFGLARVVRAVLRRRQGPQPVAAEPVLPRRAARAVCVVAERRIPNEPPDAVLAVAIRAYREHAVSVSETGPYFPPVAINLLA